MVVNLSLLSGCQYCIKSQFPGCSISCFRSGKWDNVWMAFSCEGMVSIASGAAVTQKEHYYCSRMYCVTVWKVLTRLDSKMVTKISVLILLVVGLTLQHASSCRMKPGDPCCSCERIFFLVVDPWKACYAIDTIKAVPETAQHCLVMYDVAGQILQPDCILNQAQVWHLLFLLLLLLYGLTTFL